MFLPFKMRKCAFNKQNIANKKQKPKLYIFWWF